MCMQHHSTRIFLKYSIYPEKFLCVEFVNDIHPGVFEILYSEPLLALNNKLYNQQFLWSTYLHSQNPSEIPYFESGGVMDLNFEII